MDDKLASFDAKFGGTVTNALQQFAKHMRETADECAKGTQPAPPVTPDLRSWPAEDLLVLARAAGMLWHSSNGADMLEVLSERGIELLNRAAGSYLAEPEPPAEPGTHTISVRPTQRGFAGMVAIFTEQAERADAAAQAYSELTAEPEDEDEHEPAEVGSTFNCKIMQDAQGFYARCTECPYVSRHTDDQGRAFRWAKAHDRDDDGDGREN